MNQDTRFPEVPARQPLDPNTANFASMTQIRWITNELPFMMLVPCENPFFGPLFSRLALNERRPPLKSMQRDVKVVLWSLDQSLKQEWISLERNLRALLSAMLDITTGPLPEFFRLWSFPRRFGYESWYASRKVTAAVVLRSRDAFVPLMAAVSFMIVVMEWQESRFPGFGWRDKVLKRTQIRHQWLADLEISAVTDKTLSRVGGFIDFVGSQVVWILHVIQEVFPALALYIDWGSIPPLHAPFPFLQELIPQPHDILRLLTVATSHTSSLPQHSKIFPSVERGSGQRPGERIDAFFERRGQRNAALESAETNQDKDARRNREISAGHQAPDCYMNARIYVWERVNGFHVRRAAGWHHNTLWKCYGHYQRRYDAFRHEWDLCLDFDSFDYAIDSESDSEGDAVDCGQEIAIVEDDDQPHDHNEGVYSSTADLYRIHVPVIATSVNDSVQYSSLEEVAYLRYGFIPPTSTLEDHPTAPDWFEVQKFAGTSYSPIGGTSKQTQHVICQFFGYLESALNLESIPKDMYDLLQEDSDVHRQCGLRVRCQILNGKLYYAVTPANHTEELSFTPLMTSAASVLELMRRGGWNNGTIREICSALLDEGIPFATGVAGPYQKMSFSIKPESPWRPLGYRPVNYKPDSIDYTAYESLRDRFLCSPRGRAALLAGGIVARLAREVVPYREVYLGPSDDVFDNGHSLWDGRASSAYWDDQLTNNEVDLMCGLYQVDTGQPCREGLQTVHISWWPKPSAWEASGLNVGHWSQDCEAWFQRRLSDIKSGTADLRSATQWKRSLKFSKRCAKMVRVNERLSEEYLSRRASQIYMP